MEGLEKIKEVELANRVREECFQVEQEKQIEGIVSFHLYLFSL